MMKKGKAKARRNLKEEMSPLDRLLWPLKVAEKDPQPEHPAVIGVRLWGHQVTRTPYRP